MILSNLFMIFPKTGDEAKDMRSAEAMLTGEASMRVIMTMAMAMAMMSVRRKSDVWVY